MKNLIFVIIFAVSIQLVNAQTDSTKQVNQAVAYIKDKCSIFNKDQVPVRIDNSNSIKKLKQSLDRKNINYTYDNYVFITDQISDELYNSENNEPIVNLIGGSDGRTFGKTAVPFIKYCLYTKGGETYLEVVSGNNYR